MSDCIMVDCNGEIENVSGNTYRCTECDYRYTECPECGSTDIGTDGYDDGSGHVDHKNRCRDCGHSWW